MKKSLFAGLAASAAVFVAVLTSGQSSAGADLPSADNSVMDSGTGQNVSGQGTP